MLAVDFSVNGRRYQPPARPLAVLCLDGCADEYLNAALNRKCMPHLDRLLQSGYRGQVRGALPSFTNVNNAAIVTGAPPSVTGISGNFFLDPDTGEEVMMNSADYLRCPTILAAAADAGRKVAFVTAKEKLRDILSRDLQGIAFSSEKANQARQETHGIDDVESLVGQETPPIYSAEASLYVLRSGVALLEAGSADFLYLSTTDYMQHMYRPEEPESLEFYEALDELLGQLVGQGAIVAATADHGMNGKCGTHGSPRVLYLESEINGRFGPGSRVICPITDPYVVHHGALGSCVMVHLADLGLLEEVACWLLEKDGVTEVYRREVAARKLELPADRIGDLVVLSSRDTVLGRTTEDHDLAALSRPLRSHGGRYEEMVPLLLSEGLNPEYSARACGDPRNFDVFDFVCNGVER